MPHSSAPFSSRRIEGRATCWCDGDGVTRLTHFLAEPAIQPRMRFAVLLQLAEHGTVDRATTAVVVPGSDERDLTTALENLLDDGSIEGPTVGSASLLDLAEGGRLRLTGLGMLRVNDVEV